VITDRNGKDSGPIDQFQEGIMNIRLFHGRCSHSPIIHLIAAMLVWSSFAFSGPIHSAIAKRDLQIIRALLKDNPNLVFSIDDNGRTPLHLAAMLGHKELAEFLLANKAEVNAKANAGFTPLHLAAATGKRDLVEFLLTNKAEINSKNNYDFTPLHFAAQNGHNDVVVFLLAKKAELNAKTKSGATPMHLAILQGHKELAEWLHQHGGHE
jgi:ankyrin repeat protein